MKNHVKYRANGLADTRTSAPEVVDRRKKLDGRVIGLSLADAAAAAIVIATALVAVGAAARSNGKQCSDSSSNILPGNTHEGEVEIEAVERGHMRAKAIGTTLCIHVTCHLLLQTILCFG